MVRSDFVRWGGLAVAIAAFAVAFRAHGQASGGAAPSANVAPAVREHLQKLHASNRTEIRTARMAMARGSSASVVELARMIELENERIDDRLRRAAERLGVDLEGDVYEDERERLLKVADDHLGLKLGQEFDLAYTSLLLSDERADQHRNLETFISDAERAGNGRLAEELRQVRRTLENRLAMVERVHDIEERQSALLRSGSGDSDQAGTRASPSVDDPGSGRETAPASTGR